MPQFNLPVAYVPRIYPAMHDWLKAGGAKWWGKVVGSTANVAVITGSSRTSKCS